MKLLKNTPHGPTITMEPGADGVLRGVGAAPLSLASGTFTSFSAAFGGGVSTFPPNFGAEEARDRTNYLHMLSWVVGKAVQFCERNFTDINATHVAPNGNIGFHITLEQGSGMIWFTPNAPHHLVSTSGFGSPEKDRFVFELAETGIAAFAMSTDESSHLLRVNARVA